MKPDASAMYGRSTGLWTWFRGCCGRVEAGSTRLDIYAASLCVLCMVHCVGLPLLAAILPVMAQVSENPLVHQSLVLLAAPVTLWLVCRAVLVEANWLFLALASSGLTLLLLAAFVEALAPQEELITIVGASVLGFAHMRRWSQHRCRPAEIPVIGEN